MHGGGYGDRDACQSGNSRALTAVEVAPHPLTRALARDVSDAAFRGVVADGSLSSL